MSSICHAYLKFPIQKSFLQYAKDHTIRNQEVGLVIRNKTFYNYEKYFIRLTCFLPSRQVILICDIVFFAGLQGEKTNEELLALEKEKLEIVKLDAKIILGENFEFVEAEFQLKP